MATVSQYVIAKVNGHLLLIKAKRKGFPYSIPSVGPGADPGVQAVSPQVTISHPPGDRLPLLSARPAVTSPAAKHHRSLAGTKLYCLVTEALILFYMHILSSDGSIGELWTVHVDAMSDHKGH